VKWGSIPDVRYAESESWSETTKISCCVKCEYRFLLTRQPFRLRRPRFRKAGPTRQSRFLRRCRILASDSANAGADWYDRLTKVPDEMGVVNADSVQIVPASDANLNSVKALFQEYWNSFGFTPCFQNFDAELATLPGRYKPPQGRLALALAGPDAKPSAFTCARSSAVSESVRHSWHG